MTLSNSRQHRRPRRRRGRDPHAWAGLPSYPRHPSGVPCPLPRWTAAGASVGCFPATCSLPRFPAGSASTTSLSRPAQASLALRPVGSLNRPRRPLSRGFDPSGRPDRPLVSYQNNRQLSGWNLPPLATRAIWAHWEIRVKGWELVVLALVADEDVDARSRELRPIPGPRPLLARENEAEAGPVH